MTNLRVLNTDISNKVSVIFESIGGEKYVNELFKTFDLDSNIKFKFSNNFNIPFQLKPVYNKNHTKFIVKGSKSGLIKLYTNLYENMKHKNIDIEPTEESIKATLKAVIAHEIGHALDTELIISSNKQKDIVKQFGNYISGISVDYNLKKMDFNILFITDSTKQEDIKDSIDDMKKTLIYRETNAWNIGRNIIKFDNYKEEEMFNILKEFSLATYNQINKNYLTTSYLCSSSFKEIMDKFYI